MNNGLLEFFSTDLEKVQYGQTKSVKSYGDFEILVPGVIHQTKKLVCDGRGSRMETCNIKNYPFIDFVKIASKDFPILEFSIEEKKSGMYFVLVVKCFDGLNDEKPFSITKFHCYPVDDFPIHGCRNFIKEN
jgi:hypothetical protein